MDEAVDDDERAFYLHGRIMDRGVDDGEWEVTDEEESEEEEVLKNNKFFKNICW